jgi:hypothetical protein
MKMALNKYNAPEVLSVLIKALQVAGLEETVINLKRMKVPQIINNAWMHREKRAVNLAKWGFTIKEAANISGILVPLMDSFHPFVKDYHQFIKMLAKWLEEWEYEITDENDWEVDYNAFKIKSMDTGKADRNDNEFEYANVVQMGVDVIAPVRRIVQHISKTLLRVITDPKGFQSHLYEFLQGRGAKPFFHLLASRMQEAWGRKGWDRWELVVTDNDWVTNMDALQGDYIEIDDVEIKGVRGKPKVTWKVRGQNVVFHVVADVETEITATYDSSGAQDYAEAMAEDKWEAGHEDRRRGLWASWSMLKTSQGMLDYLGQKAKAADRILKDLNAYEKRKTYGSGIKAVATGFIYLIWRNRNGSLAKDLWNLFEGRGPSMDNSNDVQRMANQWGMSGFTHDALGSIQLAATCILMLKKTRQPRVAKWVESIFAKHLSKELAESQVPPEESVLSPVQVFEARITPEIQGMVAKIYNELGKDPFKAVEFAADLAEDVNWSEGWKIVGGGAPYDPPPNVQDVTSFFRWGIEDIALVMVALLRLARQKGIALKVKRLALKDFEGSWDEV